MVENYRYLENSERGLEEEIINGIYKNVRLDVSLEESYEYPESFDELHKLEQKYLEEGKRGKIHYNLEYGNRRIKLTRELGKDVFGVYITDIDVGSSGDKRRKEKQTTLLFEATKKILENYSCVNKKISTLLLETQHKSLKDWAIGVGGNIFSWEKEEGESDPKKGNWLIFKGKVLPNNK